MGITYRSAEGHESKVSQGTAYINAVPRRLTLKFGERILTVHVVTWRKKVGATKHTRVGYIKLFTTLGNVLECGAKLESGKSESEQERSKVVDS